jgi:hypothetical protein
MYLSLPLPTDTKCHIEIIFVPYDLIVFPQHIILTLDNDATIVDLKAATANLTNLTEIDDLSTVSDRITAIEGMPNPSSSSF